jgi:RNA recognition motif-containing protein
MAQKLYVGNLSYGTTDDSLRDAFAQAGSVASATVITDRATGRSKGFGFVEMASDAMLKSNRHVERKGSRWSHPRRERGASV